MPLGQQYIIQVLYQNINKSIQYTHKNITLQALFLIPFVHLINLLMKYAMHTKQYNN